MSSSRVNKAPLQEPVQPTMPDDLQLEQSSNRSELISRARTFLSNPQIHSQDNAAKHTFLVEKGLTQDEIDSLLREIPPPVPPRTYPQPPPSNLPNMLIGIVRLFTWLTGTSAVVLFIYYRFLLPRISQSYYARHAICVHQSALMLRLNKSLVPFKEIQAKCFSNLPKPVIHEEHSGYADCRSLDDILVYRRTANIDDEDALDTPNVSILRSAIEELTLSNDSTEGTPTDNLFSHLEAKLPWLKGEQGAECQNDLWQTLNESPLFTSSSSTTENSSQILWTYVPPPVSPPPPLVTALDALHAVLPRNSQAHPLSKAEATPLRPAQRTLQALADFTGYITSQTYALGSHNHSVNSSATTGVDEIRREIRALKGLVLNRRSFLPNVGTPRPSTEPSNLAGV